jgi:hypothetical protein
MHLCSSATAERLFLAHIVRMGCEGMIERCAIDVLRMRWKVIANR